MIKIDASNPKLYNPAYLPFLTDQRQTQIFFGGSSSGKSNFILGQRTVLDLLAGGRNFLVCRNVGRTNRNSTFNEVLKGIDRMGLTQLFTKNETDLTITCNNGYQAIFKGLDDVEKVKSITPRKGVLTDVIIEEATETKHHSVVQLVKRMRGISKKTKRLTLLFNPVFRTHWIFKEYFAGRWDETKNLLSDERLFILKTTYKDNRFLAADEIYNLENEPNPYFKDVYTYGNWGVLGDLIFTNWKIQDLSGIVDTFSDFRNGLDFGYASDPAALVRSTKHNGVIYIINEVYKRGLTNNLLAGIIKPIVGRGVVYCDSAEPKSIAELNDHGITAIAGVKGADSIIHGVQWLQGLEIIVHSELQNMINELSVYQWQKDRYGESIPKPTDKNNHLIDALRYAYSEEMGHTQVSFGQTPF